MISTSNIDGNFLLHHFVSHSVKNNVNVIMFACSQTFAHYNNASRKLGINLQNAVDKGICVFHDVLSMIAEGFIYDGSSSDIPFLANPSDQNFSLQWLYNKIKSSLQSNRTNIVILDDLSAFMNIGVSVPVLADFIHYCKVTSVKHDVSFLTVASKIDNDYDSMLLLSYLMHYATMEIHLKALETGYSKDLSGQMDIVKRSVTMDSKRLHFKLCDKDVKFFAPGTSAAVL